MFPAYTHAAITINEVAWKGDNGDTANEWIELYNNGSEAVDVAGWVLQRTKLDETVVDKEIIITTDSKNPNESFIIGAGGYVILEKTDDDSAPGTAFFIYSGTFNLLDGGQILTLRTNTGATADVLNSGEDWSGTGGILDAYHTAQYTTKGWITATPTPGFKNSEIPTAHPAVEEVVAEVGKDTSAAAASVSVPTLYTIPRELQLSLSMPTRAYVNQTVTLTAETAGVSAGILQSLTHEWNFGDFNTGSGEVVTHRFTYPGEYVVTLHSQYKKYEAYARKTITVLPVNFSLTTSPHGDVQVHNDARYEVDLSGYAISAGTALLFPAGSILLPNATITIPKEKLRYTGLGAIVLRDDMKTVLAELSSWPTAPASVPSSPTVASVAPTAPQPSIVQDTSPKASVADSFQFLSEQPPEVGAPTITQTKPPQPDTPQPTPLPSSQKAAAIEGAGAVPRGVMPYLALLALIGLGILAVFAGRVKTPERPKIN